MAYNTGNPLGSTSPKDLSDNATNFDFAMNSMASAFIDRFGVRRQTLAGFEAAFNQFLANSGYETPVPYAPGEVVTRPTQTFIFGGEVYRPKVEALPFTTTNWATDESKFLFTGDQVLRSDLISTDLAKGVSLVMGGMRTVDSVATLRTLPKTGAKSAYIMGYYGQGTQGAGPVYLDEAAGAVVDDGGLTFIANDGGVWRRPATKILDITQFGGKGDNVFDNGPIILKMRATAILLQYCSFYFPSGFWKTSETVRQPTTNCRVYGDGVDISVISCSAAAKPVVEVLTGTGGGIVEDVTLRHSVTPVAGGDGILWAIGGVTDEGKIRRVKVQGNWHGLHLGGTGYGTVEEIFASNNLQDGVSIINSNAYNICQWYIKNVLSQANDGNGLRVQSVSTVNGALSIGEVSGFRTFGNTGYGIIATGTPQCGVYSMRMKDCFLGGDGQGEIYLDTIGNLHTLTDTFIELAGGSATGSAGNTPATMNAHGITLTGGTPDLTIVGGTINGCTNSGIYSASTGIGGLRLIGTKVCNNGIAQNGGAANRSGIFLLNPETFTGTGIRVYSETIGQSYGAYYGGGGRTGLNSSDLRGNNVAAISGNTGVEWGAGNIYS